MAERTEQYSDQMRDVSGVYSIYRIVLPLVLLVSSLSPDSTLLGEYDSDLFLHVWTLYAIFGIFIAFFVSSNSNILGSQHVIAGFLIVDILALTLIIFTSGGIASGPGLLMIVSIAASSILIRGRMSTFLAAVATLSVIYCEIYLSLTIENRPNQFVQAGILGILLFATSLYVQTVTTRAFNTALLADQQAREIIDLEKLNNEIIQRMRTGIVLVSSTNEIASVNSAARVILMVLNDIDFASLETLTLPDAIAEQIKLWKLNPKRDPQPIPFPGSSKQIQLNFAFLREDANSDILIFLEDNRQIIQRVRQSKLASLGRLTASIAHEVRNPLGAISHASQLLRESESMTDDDRRMVEIILKHCERVNMIIEDVLDASKSDDSTPRKILLKSWMSNFIEGYRATHEVCSQPKITRIISSLFGGFVINIT
jgi:two-component system, NtrC family, sensor histidine kinase PilS